MADEQDKLVKKLNQIRVRLTHDLDELGELKINAPAEIIEQIENLERQGWNTVIEAQETQKKINLDLQNTIERNTIMHRTANRSGKRDSELYKGGNIRI